MPSSRTQSADFAEVIVRGLTRHFELPAHFIEFLFLLLVKEADHGYPAVHGGDPVSSYIKALAHILKKLPKVREGSFFAPIHRMACLEPEDFYALANISPYGFYVQKLKPSERDIKWDTLFAVNSFWWRVLFYGVHFEIPTLTRFEHMHVVGQSGSGKTTLLQRLIIEDVQTSASVIVLAPKGSMVGNIARLKCIDPERVVLVQPEDFLEHPFPLNIFDIDPHDERVVNGVVNLVRFIFDSKDSATTPKQTTLLNYCVRLLVHHKGSNLMTLRKLMTYEALPPEYDTSQLSEAGREFFATQFHVKKTYGETKEQMLWRIDSLTENRLVETLFTQTRSSFDMLTAIEQGKVILIDSSIRHAGEMGSAFIGRLFIALVAIATQQRDTTKALRPCFFYIDECATYLTGNIEGMLERSREARVGLILAHQQLAQLRTVSTQLEASVLTNTSIKAVGSCAYDDSVTFAREMDVEPEQLRRQPQLHFHLKVKGVTRRAVPIKLDPAYMDKQEKRELPKRMAPKVEEVKPEPPKVEPKPEPPKVQQPEKKPSSSNDDLDFFS